MLRRVVWQCELLTVRWVQLLREKVLGLYEKSYHFLKNRTTF